MLRDAADPTNCEVVRLHRANVTAVAAEKEGNFFASGDADGTVKVWARNAQGEFIQQWSKDLQGEVTGLSFFNNGQRLAASTTSRTVRAFIWKDDDVMGDTPVVHQNDVNAVDVRQAKPLIMVSASSDHSLAFYPSPFKKLGGTAKEHKNIINNVRFSPSGERLVTVGSDKSIIVYSGTDIALQGYVGDEGKAHDKGILDVHWIDDGNFATCGNDCAVKLWSAEERALLRTLKVDAH